MIEREATIVNLEGLHARPAARIVRLASSFDSEIEICKDGVGVNGKSIMGVMMLAAECGSSITIRANGPDAEQAAEALAAHRDVHRHPELIGRHDLRVWVLLLFRQAGLRLRRHADDRHPHARQLVDAAGTPIYAQDGDRNVRVTVSGAGTLAGFGNGNPQDASSLQSGLRKTFHGQAVAVVVELTWERYSGRTGPGAGREPARPDPIADARVTDGN